MMEIRWLPDWLIWLVYFVGAISVGYRFDVPSHIWLMALLIGLAAVPLNTFMVRRTQYLRDRYRVIANRPMAEVLDEATVDDEYWMSGERWFTEIQRQQQQEERRGR